MKKLLLLLPFVALLLNSCSNDFTLTAPWKEVPVVYAILSAKDAANYIRVEKAFLDPNKSALTVAQIADSIYYPENAISVYLERNDSVKHKIKLLRVDGNLEGIPRKPGIFATQPNWLYKFFPTGSDTIVPGAKYTLIIQRADGKPDITATTIMPKDFKFLIPAKSDLPPKLSFSDSLTTSVEWRGDEHATYFTFLFKIQYRELAADGTLLGHHTINWRVSDNFKRGESHTQTNGGLVYNTIFDIDGKDFFRVLSDSIAPSTTKYRYFDLCEMEIEGGGSEIENYLLTLEANSGITGSEIVTTYSNLSEGFGIFTAKNKERISKIKIQPQTVDRMNQYPLTKVLNFQK
jgi:hypothetical protein